MKDAFRITLEGWTQDEDADEPEEFIKKTKIKKGTYKKACQHALNNLSQGIFSPKENKRSRLAEKSIYEESEDNSDSNNRILQDDRHSDQIVLSPRTEVEMKMMTPTHKSSEKPEEETARLSENQKFNWSDFPNEEPADNGPTRLERVKSDIDPLVNTTIKVPEKSLDSLNATKSTTDKPNWPVRGGPKLEKLIKIDNKEKSRDRQSPTSKHTIEDHFEKPQNSQLALIEKFQYLNKLNYKASNLMKPVHKRKPSLSPLDVGVEFPKISDALHKSNSNTPQVHPSITKRPGKGLSGVSTNKTLSFEHTARKLPSHDNLKNIFEDSHVAILTKKILGIHRESGDFHSDYVNKTILDESRRSRPINPLNIFKAPMDLRPKNLSPFPNNADNRQQINLQPIGNLVNTWEHVKKGQLSSRFMRLNFPNVLAGRRGRSHAADEVSELVQQILTNTPNNLNKSSMMEKVMFFEK